MHLHFVHCEIIGISNKRMRSGSVVECLTRDQGAASSNLTDVTAMCPLARHINPSLVLVQPRKTRPYILTDIFLMGRKESNQTKSNKSALCCIPVKIFLFFKIVTSFSQ